MNSLKILKLLMKALFLLDIYEDTKAQDCGWSSVVEYFRHILGFEVHPHNSLPQKRWIQIDIYNFYFIS